MRSRYSILVVVALGVLVAGCPTQPIPTAETPPGGEEVGDPNRPEDSPLEDGLDVEPPRQACFTSFYDDEFEFGFDLPFRATLDPLEEVNYIYELRAKWTNGPRITYIADVTGPWYSLDLRSIVDGWAEGLAEDDGIELRSVTPLTLTSGQPAFLTILVHDGGVIVHRITTLANNFEFNVTVLDGVFNDESILAAQRVVGSLCVRP